MSNKISEALYVVGNTKNVLKIEDVDAESYRKKYRNHLYCPYPDCKARLSFINGKIRPNYFRTWRYDEHIEGCANGLNYKEEESTRRKQNPDYEYALSNEHIKSVLRRAHDHLQEKTETNDATKAAPRQPNSGENIKKNSIELGTATLLKDGVGFTDGREMNVYIRDINSLNEEDIGKIRCVTGEIRRVWLQDDFAYLNLKSNNENVAIRFSESFKSTYPNEFALFNYIEKYVKTNEQCVCCCVGLVTRTSNGIYIIPDRVESFSIDNLSLYQIVNKIVVGTL